MISEFCSRKAFSEREGGTYVPRDLPISRAQSWVHHWLGPRGRKDSGRGRGGEVTLGPPEMDSFHVPLEQKVRSAY